MSSNFEYKLGNRSDSMDKSSTNLQTPCNYLSMLQLKSIQVRKKAPWRLITIKVTDVLVDALQFFPRITQISYTTCREYNRDKLISNELHIIFLVTNCLCTHSSLTFEFVSIVASQRGK